MYDFQMSRYEYDSIRSLGFCYAFTNSELSSFNCHRKYSYEYIENLDNDSFSKAMFFGTCWHFMCESVLIEISKNDKMINHDKLNEIYSDIVIPFIDEELNNYNLEESIREEVYENVVSNISLGMYGWLDKWASEIHPNFQIIDVERELIKPISYKRTQFKSSLKLIKDKHDDVEIYRFPMIGELNISNHKIYRDIKCGEYNSGNALFSEIQEFEVPVYKVGKLDCILLERDSNSLWVLDHKTSATPLAYANKMQFDLQLNSYCSLLRYAIQQGLFKQYGDVFLGGIIWDIASSKYNKPSYDKEGYLKQVKRGYITKSVALNILKDSKYDKIRDTYNDYLEVLSDRDDKNYIIMKELISESEIDRVDHEDYANAKAIIDMRSNCYNIDMSDIVEINTVMKRYPICMTYNFCKFFNSCSVNSLLTDPTMIPYNRKAKQFWISR